MAGPPTARGQRVCISGVSSQPPGSLWRHSGQGEEQVGPKAEVAHAALGPRCREGLRGGKGFGAQRHLPGERNRQTIYRPLRGGFTEPPWPLGRGARSQQGGRRPGSRSAARAGAPRPRASSPRTGSEAQRLQLVRAENDAGEGVEGKGAGPRVRSRALLPGEDQASSVEARTGPGSQPRRVGARFPPSPQLRRSLSVGPWPCRSLDERREAG